jgi:L,D-transpeptidase catalytic domain
MSKSNSKSKKISAAMVALIVLSLFSFIPTESAFAQTTPKYNTEEFKALFADANFLSNWQRTDYPVADDKGARSWYWGPAPTANGFFEDYKETKPYGKRLVQYFDKARMEINDPIKPTVTNGLLIVEMITGKLQKGDNTFEDKGDGAFIPLAGDPDNIFPTYKDLTRAYNKPFGFAPGTKVQTAFVPADRQGESQTKYLNDKNTEIISIQNNMGIPAAFWNFLNRKGQVYSNGTYKDEVVSDWLFSTGLPITEAYWAQVKLAGKPVDVMFQAFERRTLTYTPSNPEAFRVEMGNAGAHYVKWRYNDKLPKFVSPGAEFLGESQLEWYEVTGDALNVRTGPGTSFPNPKVTENQPFLTVLYKGNKVQVIKEVKGEKLVGNNDVWYQYYQDPDLFVYSGFTKKIAPAQMPTPPRYHSGLWVSVSLEKQMMAIYDGNVQIYRTYIASGRPNDTDPKKDFRTPKGTFKVDGSYRPKSQTMEGDAASKATGEYYKIENIRNVSYFYRDYSIHGTYWHARFGTVPQSHGCVNATVYDAGLIYQLKAGTIVDVY